MDSSAQLRTLQVSTQLTVNLAAHLAAFHLELPGSTLLVGDAALKKAAEIRKLAGELAEVGLASDKIFLTSVRGVQESGLLGNKSTSAVYSLRIEVGDLSLLGAVLGVLNAQKNGNHRIEWRYADSDREMLPHLAQACAIVKNKAETMAAAMGETLDGIHSLSESVDSGPHHQPVQRSLHGPAPTGVASKFAAVDFGFQMANEKPVVLNVHAQYRLK